MSERETLRLFEATGIELEYMLVDSKDLDVRPLADELLERGGGEYGDVVRGPITWSNELALHVIELKTSAPAPMLVGLAAEFQREITHINGLLEPLAAKLLPTGMHPWMNPATQLRLWPHANGDIYKTFDRIFDCRSHGFANLQSMHLNLPFADDREFEALHAAIRLVLPLIPGLAASSPLADGKPTGLLDTRLEMYRTNARRVPSITGLVIPEQVFTRRDYEQSLLGRIYAELAPLDPERTLCHEWVNSRGCIARFDRMAIEIRVIDMQECPQADIAVAAAISSAVRSLVEEHSCSSRDQREWHERDLAGLLREAVRDGDAAVIENRRFLTLFGYPERGRARVHELWQHIVEAELARDSAYAELSPALATILTKGCLARRIAAAVGPKPDRETLHAVYGRLAECLAQGTPFGAP